MMESDAGRGVFGGGSASTAPESGLCFGDYLLEEQIAHGGMGVVYRARQLSLGRTVAVKLLLLGRYSSAQSVERFRREAHAVATLRHPNIVSIHEVGECEGQHYFAMEYVEGQSLAACLRDGPLPARRAAEMARDIAEAIHYAHLQGVLHRDLKPSNVLIDPLGQVRIMDFGLAKRLDGSSDLTLSGEVVGTPSYLAPELASGRAVDNAPASDIYALGVMLYELLTGRPPFLAGTLPEMLLRVRETEPVPVRTLNPSIHRDLETICLKCLHKEPARRYPTARALAEDLDRWLQQRPIEARRAGLAERAYLWCRRKPRQAAMLGLLVVVVLLLMAALSGIAVISTRARRHAEAQEWSARRRAYAADVNLVQQALDLNNLGRAEELLQQHRPAPGQPDLRDWEWRYLWQQCRDEAQFTLCRKPNAIWGLAASPDGRWLAVGEEFRSGLSVWDWSTRQRVLELPPGEGAVMAAFSPRAPLLAHSYESGRRVTPLQAGVRLLNVTNGQIIADLPLEGRCRAVAFSADGESVLTSSSAPGNRITVWQVSDGRKRIEVVAPQFEGVGTPFAATADLKFAVYRAEMGEEIRLVDLVQGTECWRIKAADETVTALAFSPDGRTLVSGPGYTESAIRLWDVATGKELGRLEGHTSWVSQFAFLPDGRTLASASADQTIRLWDVPGRRPLGTLRGHRLEIWRLIVMPDGVTLVSGSKDGTVNAWDTRSVQSDRRRIVLPPPVAGWHFPANRESVLTVDQQGRVAEWSGAYFSDQRPILETGHAITKACFSEDGVRLAVQAPTGEIRLWDLRRKARLGEITVPGSSAFPTAFREGGRKLVLVNWAGQDFHEWDVDRLQPSQSWQVVADRPNSSLSWDQRWCLSIGQEATTVIRDLVAGQSVSNRFSIEAPGGIALSTDGRTIAAVSKQSYVRLWDRETGRELATFRGFLQGLHGAIFSANDRRLAIGGNGREAVKLWDLESRQELLTLAGQGSIFSRLKFSPDGKLLAARSNQGFLHIWRAPSWEEIAAAERGAESPEIKSSLGR